MFVLVQIYPPEATSDDCWLVRARADPTCSWSTTAGSPNVRWLIQAAWARARSVRCSNMPASESMLVKVTGSIACSAFTSAPRAPS